MRRIGNINTICFDGNYCNPYSKSECQKCNNKCMKVYSVDAGRKSDRLIMKKHGFGLMLSSIWRDISKLPYFCMDNQAFGAYKNNIPYDPSRFLNNVKKCVERNKTPDFIIVPDIVAGGYDSLKFSLNWLKKLPKRFKYYLAVQDGMEIDEVEKHLDKFSGIFIGGTMKWKKQTAKDWINLAHKYIMPCHIGRVGTKKDIIWAYELGADSIDSTSWARNNTYEKHLIGAILNE